MRKRGSIAGWGILNTGQGSRHDLDEADRPVPRILPADEPYAPPTHSDVGARF